MKARARQLGLNDIDVARALDLSQARYAGYVGDKREPDFATLLRICSVLRISPNSLLGFDERSTPGEDEELRSHVVARAARMDGNVLRIMIALMDAVLAQSRLIRDGD